MKVSQIVWLMIFFGFLFILLVIKLTEPKTCKEYGMVQRFKPDLSVKKSPNGGLDEIVDNGKWITEKKCIKY